MEAKSDKPTSTFEVLTSSGFDPEKSLESRKVMVTAEEGKKYTLAIADEKESVLFQVDGEIIRKGLRCDKLILVKLCAEQGNEEWAEIFVELKGKDVAHAIEQLKATIVNKIFKHESNKIVRARIVAASFPANKSNPIMEKAKQEFAKMHCDLRGIENGRIDRV